MKTAVSRSVLLVLLTVVFAVFSISPVSAGPASVSEQRQVYNNNLMAPNTNVFKIGFNQLTGLMNYVGTWLDGICSSDGQCLSYGMAPDLSRMVAFLVTQPPAQTSYYIADVMHNSGLAQPAYAQGIGFSSLTPVLKLWKAFRNLSYFLFIIIFVVVGFMIMFRKQIDHQVVVSVQMALPKIIFTLILITFSYAIAGFVVDLIYLLIFVVTSLFQQFGIITDASAAQGVLFGESVWRIGIHYFISPIGEAGAGAANSISAIIQGSFGIKGLDALTDIVVYAITVIAIIIALFRTLLSLLSAYIAIIVSVIFSPIQLMFNAIPGSNTFSAWMRGLVANAAVFPAVAIMVMIGAVLATGTGVDATNAGFNLPEDIGLSATSQTNGFGYGEAGGFVPPLIVSEPNSSAFGIQSVNAIIGLGILLLLPEIAKIVKEALEVKEAYGETALANFGAGSKPITAPLGLIGSGIASGLGQQMGGGIVTAWVNRKARLEAGSNSRSTHGGTSVHSSPVDSLETDS